MTTNEAIANMLKRWPCRELQTGNILTCPVRLSFPTLFKPKAVEDGQEPKYSVSLLFPKGADISLLREAAKHCAVGKFGAKAGSMNLHSPFRDQADKQFEGYEPGCVYFNATSKQRPGVKLRDARTDATEDDIYPGCWALVTVRPFAFESKAKKGVSFGLQNVMKLAEGERFGGGGARAEEEFEAIEGMEDLDALLGGAGEAVANGVADFM